MGKMGESKIDASTLADGTQVSYEGAVWTAFPSIPWLLPEVVRWQSDDGSQFAGEDRMTAMLADGATVLGINQAAIDEYHAIIAAARG